MIRGDDKGAYCRWLALATAAKSSCRAIVSSMVLPSFSEKGKDSTT